VSQQDSILFGAKQSGLGQSEKRFMNAWISFCFLKLAGAGDELQDLKRGIMENGRML